MRSKTAANARLYYESGQELVEMTALEDSGDRTVFESGDKFWSGASGKESVVRPDGLVTGGKVSEASSGDDDVVDVAALTAYLAGELEEIDANSDFAITRPSGDNAKISSIIVDDSGSLAEEEGSEGTDTSFSSERGAEGGPPYIPEGAIEIAQVRLTTSASGKIKSSQIFQVPGTHQERYDYPLWNENWTKGEVEFLTELSKIHTDDKPKGVYAEYYTPIFAEVPNASEFVPPENSHSVSSEQVYGGTVGSSSSSLNQGSFTARLQSGVDDGILSMKNETCWFKFMPDRLVTNKYVACQGILGVERSFPAGESIQASCTISATEEAESIAEA